MTEDLYAAITQYLNALPELLPFFASWTDSNGAPHPRIFARELPQGGDQTTNFYPAATVHMVNDQPLYEQRGPAGASLARMQISVWCSDLAGGQTRSLRAADQIRKAMSGRNIPGAGSCRLIGMHSDRQAQEKVFQEIMDFAIWYSE